MQVLFYYAERCDDLSFIQLLSLFYAFHFTFVILHSSNFDAIL